MEEKKVNVKNLKLYSGIYSRILVNKTLMTLPYVGYTLGGILFAANITGGHSPFLDELEYQAKINQTTNEKGEVYEEKEYLHPSAIKKVDDSSTITVTYPWSEKGEEFEREIIEYDFNSTDFITLNNVINNKELAFELKNKLETLEINNQVAVRIADENEVSFEINVTKVDENDFIIQKENYDENEFAFLAFLFSIVGINALGHFAFFKDINKEKKDKVKQLKRSLKEIKKDK